MNLADRLLKIHAALDSAGLEHAFGGAIALAYWTLEPRGTRDIDVNVFLRAEENEQVLSAMPAGLAHDAADAKALERDGQRRLWWDDTPVDLFLSYLPLHDDAAKHRRMVPFEGTEIPVLGPVELAVFKAMFARTRDWADIEAMLAAETLDLDATREQLVALVGAEAERIERLADAARRARA